jgi:hypothetical protein
MQVLKASAAGTAQHRQCCVVALTPSTLNPGARGPGDGAGAVPQCGGAGAARRRAGSGVSPPIRVAWQVRTYGLDANPLCRQLLKFQALVQDNPSVNACGPQHKFQRTACLARSSSGVPCYTIACFNIGRSQGAEAACPLCRIMFMRPVKGASLPRTRAATAKYDPVWVTCDDLAAEGILVSRELKSSNAAQQRLTAGQPWCLVQPAELLQCPG